MTRLTSLRLAVCFGALSFSAVAQLPDDTWTGSHPNDAMGTVVATLGDCNNDGVDDIAFASPYADLQIFFPIPFTLPDVGRVQVRSGADGALLHDWYGAVSGDEFGFSVANAGDIDGDGHDDVLIGIPLADGPFPSAGKVQVRSGATGKVLRTHDGPQRFARFGHSVAGGARLNLDNYDDYAIGMPLFDVDDSTGGFDEEGAVRWIDGVTGGLGANLEGNSISGAGSTKVFRPRHYGWSLDVSTFVLVIGAPRSDVFFPLTSDTLELAGIVHGIHILTGDEIVRDGGGGTRTGEVVDLGETVVGGEKGIAIGSPGAAGIGSVAVVSPDFASGTTSSVSITFGSANAPIGTSLAFVGDRDGDGIDDLAIGAPTADVGSPFGVADAGTITVRSGATGSVLETLNGTAPFERFGTSVAGGDLDGDGSPELLVGVPGDDAGGVGAGAAWFYRGLSCPATSTPYGADLAGTNGTPVLSSTEPILGETVVVSLTNSLGAPTTAWFFLGTTATSRRHAARRCLRDVPRSAQRVALSPRWRHPRRRDVLRSFTLSPGARCRRGRAERSGVQSRARARNRHVTGRVGCASIS